MMCSNLFTKDLVNSVLTFEWTIKRLAAIQLCPEFIILLVTIESTAWSRSASSKTMYGSLPPNSRTTFFIFFAALVPAEIPAGVEPVSVTAATRSSSMTPPIFFQADLYEALNLSDP